MKYLPNLLKIERMPNPPVEPEKIPISPVELEIPAEPEKPPMDEVIPPLIPRCDKGTQTLSPSFHVQSILKETHGTTLGP
ncbi:hypothetical protein TNCV_882261 [Trichonephila clavipes]|nr:hypothetical protein TNCV_882261 [Trichonephila clavipes]